MLFSMIYAFGSIELDMAKVELRDNGEPRSIEPQVFALIAYLAEHRDRMVSRDELFEKLWEGRVVSDSALASRIKSARQALGDDGRTQAIIKTVHGQGLRFIADVRVQHAPVVAISPAVSEGVERSAPGVAPDATSRPSIAVLPFRSTGATGDWATVADGLPHDLITELARLRWLFVVARGSSFRLRSEDPDPREYPGIAGNPDPTARGRKGAADIAGQPRCLVGLSSRAAAHPWLQPTGQRARGGVFQPGCRPGRHVRPGACRPVFRAFPDGVHAPG